MLKKNIGRLEKKNDNDVDADVVQLEHSNNKCYTSTFRYSECLDSVLCPHFARLVENYLGPTLLFMNPTKR